MTVEPSALRSSHPYRLFDRHPRDEHYRGREVSAVRAEAAVERLVVRVWPDPPVDGIGFELNYRPDRLDLVVRDAVVVDAALF